MSKNKSSPKSKSLYHLAFKNIA